MKDYKKIVLKCGIPLYLFNDTSLKQTFVNYIIKYGSSGEYFNFNLNNTNCKVSSGYAHYLEHLLGEHSKYGNIYDNFTKRYYIANAYTDIDHTSYYFYGVNDIKKSIKELIEAIETPVFDYKDVNKTRHAIEEEAATSVDDCIDMINYLTLRNLFKDFEYVDSTLSTIGNREITRSITTRNLRKCYNAFYTDNNKVLVIAGNINEKEMVDYLNEIYDNIPRHNSNVVLPSYNYDELRKKEDVLVRDDEEDLHSLGIKIKKLDGISNNNLYFSLYVILCNILYGNYYIKLNNMGIIDAHHYCYINNCGNYFSIINTYASSKSNEYIKRIIDKINKRDITKEEFELFKRVLIANEVRQLDNKYKAPSKFGNKMFRTTSYSDIDFIKSRTYDEYLDIINRLDFNTYTKSSIIKRG